MITLKNTQTNEAVNIHGVVMTKSGKVVSKTGRYTTRFVTKWDGILQLMCEEDGTPYLLPMTGWEVVKTKRTHKEKDWEEKDEREEQGQEWNNGNETIPQQEEEHEEREQEEEPQPQPKAKESKRESESDDAAQLFAILSRMGGVDESKVLKIVQEEIRRLAEGDSDKYRKIKIKAREESGDDSRKIIDTVKAMVINDRIIGRYPYLYGPAGSGKSTIAKRVAEELGLPFYSVSSLLQKYEMEGYTNAAGEYVQTSFYNAWNNGGIFNFDEFATSSPEVQVAFNTAVAQLLYNFPKEGMKEAHPDFHIIACDNTIGRGQNNKYSARYQMDVSTLDRYTFIEVDYSESHDLNMAGGDRELVRFIKAVRSALDESQTNYLATPRAEKAITSFIAMGMSAKEAIWYGLCSGWEKRDTKTIATRVNVSNVYGTAFKEIAAEF